jgi:hypothetical protein
MYWPWLCTRALRSSCATFTRCDLTKPNTSCAVKPRRKRSSESTRRRIPTSIAPGEILEDFAGFWTAQVKASERRWLLAELFQEKTIRIAA